MHPTPKIVCHQYPSAVRNLYFFISICFCFEHIDRPYVTKSHDCSSIALTQRMIFLYPHKPTISEKLERISIPFSSSTSPHCWLLRRGKTSELNAQCHTRTLARKSSRHGYPVTWKQGGLGYANGGVVDIGRGGYDNADCLHKRLLKVSVRLRVRVEGCWKWYLVLLLNYV